MMRIYATIFDRLIQYYEKNPLKFNALEGYIVVELVKFVGSQDPQNL